MYIENLTASTFILSGGNILSPGSGITIEDNLYSGNSSLKNQVDNLISHGMVFAVDVPEEPVEEIPGLPEGYEASEQELAITKGEGVASLAVDTDAEDIDYGSVELVSENGGKIKLKSYCAEDEYSMFELNKNSNEEGNILLFKINEMAIMQIGSTGAEATFGFDGKEPILPPTLDSGSATTEDVVNALVDLGLFRGV